MQLKPGLASARGRDAARARPSPRSTTGWPHVAAASTDRLHVVVDRSDQRESATHSPSRWPTSASGRIDVLYLLKPDNVQAMAELDDRVLRHACIGASNPRPDAALQIQYMHAPAGTAQHVRSGPLLRELRALVTQSRPLRASDVRRANDATQDDNAAVFADSARIAASARRSQDARRRDRQPYLATACRRCLPIRSRTARPSSPASMQYLHRRSALLERAAQFRACRPQAGASPTRGCSRRSPTCSRRFARWSTRWTQKLNDFDNALHRLRRASRRHQRCRSVRRAASRGAARSARSSIRCPQRPRLCVPQLDGKGNAMQNRLDQFAGDPRRHGNSFAALFNRCRRCRTAEFDSQPFDVIADRRSRRHRHAGHLARILTGQLAAIAKARNDDVDKQLRPQRAAAASAADRVLAMQAAAKALLGDDFQIVPEFTCLAAQGGEWANAVGCLRRGDAARLPEDHAAIDFPVDEWFYGAAACARAA